MSKKRKRPPGAGRRVLRPTQRNWATDMDPDAVMHRIRSSVPIAQVRTEYMDALIYELRTYLDGIEVSADVGRGLRPVPVPEHFSLFGLPDVQVTPDGTPGQSEMAIVAAYGLPFAITDTLRDFVEDHAMYREWDMYAIDG